MTHSSAVCVNRFIGASVGDWAGSLSVWCVGINSGRFGAGTAFLVLTGVGPAGLLGHKSGAQVCAFIWQAPQAGMPCLAHEIGPLVGLLSECCSDETQPTVWALSWHVEPGVRQHDTGDCCDLPTVELLDMIRCCSVSHC